MMEMGVGTHTRGNPRGKVIGIRLCSSQVVAVSLKVHGDGELF